MKTLLSFLLFGFQRCLHKLFTSSLNVFQRKKAADDCTESQGLSKARAYVNVTLKKHLGKMNISGSSSLIVPGMEKKEEEAAYVRVRADLYGGHWKYWEKKLEEMRNWDY
jgi:hypothetical protein